MQIFTGAQTRYQIGYHVVWGVKYHKHILNTAMKKALLALIKDIAESYDYHFYCLGIAPNHVHLFIGAPPKVASAILIRTIKSITAQELFHQFPYLKKQLWGGELWKDGYYVGTVGEGQTEEIIRNYLAHQDEDDEAVVKEMKQLKLFV